MILDLAMSGIAVFQSEVGSSAYRSSANRELFKSRFARTRKMNVADDAPRKACSWIPGHIRSAYYETYFGGGFSCLILRPQNVSSSVAITVSTWVTKPVYFA